LKKVEKCGKIEGVEGQYEEIKATNFEKKQLIFA
jgi:hypothetical protein